MYLNKNRGAFVFSILFLIDQMFRQITILVLKCYIYCCQFWFSLKKAWQYLSILLQTANMPSDTLVNNLFYCGLDDTAIYVYLAFKMSFQSFLLCKLFLFYQIDILEIDLYTHMLLQSNMCYMLIVSQQYFCLSTLLCPLLMFD